MHILQLQNGQQGVEILIIKWDEAANSRSFCTEAWLKMLRLLVFGWNL